MGLKAYVVSRLEFPGPGKRPSSGFCRNRREAISTRTDLCLGGETSRVGEKAERPREFVKYDTKGDARNISKIRKIRADFGTWNLEPLIIEKWLKSRRWF